jgi:hypothetical protein
MFLNKVQSADEMEEGMDIFERKLRKKPTSNQPYLFGGSVSHTASNAGTACLAVAFEGCSMQPKSLAQ